jgi:hypothetical protein
MVGEAVGSEASVGGTSVALNIAGGEGSALGAAQAKSIWLISIITNGSKFRTTIISSPLFWH